MAGESVDGKFVWVDGKLVPFKDATIHILSHSMQYGGSIFEGIRAYELSDGRSALFRGEDHYRRFLDSMKALGYTCQYSVNDFMKATAELLKANQFKACYVRPVAYIDERVRGLSLPDPADVKVSIAAWTWGKYMGAAGDVGIRAMVSTYRRAEVATSLPWAKIAGGYLTSILARREAAKNGIAETLLLDPNGMVAEGCGDNLFMVKDGIIYTPPPTYILPGFTRDCAMKIAAFLGYPVKEAPMSRNQLYLADEIFITGTAVEIASIKELDHRTIGDQCPGPVTRKVIDLFYKSTRGEIPEFRTWNTLLS